MKYLGRNLYAGKMRGQYFDNTPQGSYSSRAPRATNKRTPKQIRARAILAHAAQAWKKLTPEEQKTWAQASKRMFPQSRGSRPSA